MPLYADQIDVAIKLRQVIVNEHRAKPVNSQIRNGYIASTQYHFYRPQY